jgi:hypothetical protein
MKLFFHPPVSKKCRLLNILVIILIIFQAGQHFYNIDRISVDVPFGDQWDYYEAFFSPHSPWAVFSWQHGPHRQGAGSFFIWAANRLTGWNQRAQSFLIGGVILLAALAALWLKRRLIGSLQWPDAIPALMILTLNLSGLYAITPNVAHGALPLLIVMLVCLSLTIRRALWRYPCLVGLNFLAVFTGFGLCLGLVMPWLLALDIRHSIRRRSRSQAWLGIGSLVLALASLALFFHNYSFREAAGGLNFPNSQWNFYPAYIAVELASLVLPNQAAGVSGVIIGLVIGLVLIAVLWTTAARLFRYDEHYPLNQVVSLLLGFSLVFAVLAAVGRLDFGLRTATASRYLPLLLPAVVGLYLFFSSRTRWPERRILFLMLLALAIASAVPSWHKEEVERFRKAKMTWVEAYVATSNVARATAISHFSIYPESRGGGKALERKLEWLRERHYSFFRKNARSRPSQRTP